MSITEQTRRESYRKMDKRTRQQIILSAWDGEMTAREIGYKLGYADLNGVKPRITELARAGKLIEAGKKHDPITDRSVTAWTLAR